MSTGVGGTNAGDGRPPSSGGDEGRTPGEPTAPANVDVDAVVEARILPLFTPDTQVSLEYPARVYSAQNRDQLRAMLGQLVRDGTMDGPRILINDAGEITELTWRLPTPGGGRVETTTPSRISRIFEGGR